MGNHLPCCVVLDWDCGALLVGHAGLDHGCYYVQQHDELSVAVDSESGSDGDFGEFDCGGGGEYEGSY